VDTAQLRSRRDAPFGLRSMLPIGVFIALLVASPWVLWLLPHTPVVCAFRALTGLPCPGCGATRAFFHLGSGHVLTSLRINPLGLVLWLFLVGAVTVKAGFLPERFFERTRRRLLIVGMSAAFAAWLVALARHFLGK